MGWCDVVLCFDTETSGLLRRDVPLGDASQPWACVIAAELVDMDGKSLDFFSAHIRADGRTIGKGATDVHGLSSRDAAKAGVNEIVALGMLVGFASQARYLVGHGVDFDRQVIEGMLIRRQKDTRIWVRPGLEHQCTMRAATNLCAIKPDDPRTDGGYRWPSLDEACSILLGKPPREGHHDAWGDMKRSQSLWFYLRDRGALEVAA